MPRRNRTARGLAALAAVASAGCGATEPPPDEERAADSASGGTRGALVCDLVATPGGAHGASGTPEDPVGGVAALNDALEPGLTACLREGTFEAPETRITTPRVTVRSFPGERATISGRLWVDAKGVEVVGLVLDSGSVGAGSTSPTVTAADVGFRGVEVTNHHEGGTCFGLGSDDGYGWAVRTVIERSRIHDCGQLPPTNHHHGIYAAHARDVVIRDNLIYANADRGVQLFPDADRTKVTGNVIAGNGEGVIISGDEDATSDGSLIAGNVISGSTARWNVESDWYGDLVGSGNVVRGNCLFSESEPYLTDGGISPSRLGFLATENLVAEPLYAAPEEGSFVLGAESPCLSVIPASSPASGESTAPP